ncbi:hypothetical protein [Thermoleophilum album]|uniref:Uncharacterized protein n=1 Tax=Thermoleophilum album TaxID=29539 RepID=A0A1H6FXH9_THEAL|nr:hypothetical protein [Thermoleophilum album]SEH15497.1 hypothetical protein SAMN02745716_1972 [Thermoleophilum album]
MAVGGTEQARTRVIVHPNRDTPAAKATRLAIFALLLASIGLFAIVTIGGWSELQGAQGVTIGYIAVYALIAVMVLRWRRGVLPVAAALAVLIAVVAAIAGPAWYERDRSGFAPSDLPPDVLGTLTLAIVPVQLLLIAFALRGFAQKWNVEVELDEEEARRYHRGDWRGPARFATGTER